MRRGNMVRQRRSTTAGSDRLLKVAISSPRCPASGELPVRQPILSRSNVAKALRNGSIQRANHSDMAYAEAMSLRCLFGHRPSLTSILRRKDGYAALCDGCSLPNERRDGGRWKASGSILAAPPINPS